MKIKHKNILIGISLFIIFFFFNYLKGKLSIDEIWNYGFAYNIKNGMIPYRDFNMILTPLYSYILALFIVIFGNSFFSIITLNCILSTFIEFLLIKKHGKKGLLFLPVLSCISFSSYNLLSLLLFIIFISINNSKYKDNQYLIGFIISLMVLTKQTIGGLLFIASFIFSKRKKDYLIGFLPLCIIFLLYLFFTNSLYNFFDYCLFGMVDFTNDNTFSSTDFTIILFIIPFILILYFLTTEKFKNKELLYILLFQIMAFPIFDFSHICISVIPILSYFFTYNNCSNIINKIKLYLTTFIFVMTLFIHVNCLIFLDANIYHNKNSFLNNNLLPFDIDDFVYSINDEIKRTYNEYTIFHLNTFAYLYKLETNEKINKYDLTNTGNMGYNGEEKWINEINNYCQNNKCLIVLEHFKDINKQLSIKINNYVTNNYKFEKTIGVYDLYTNNKTDEK